MFKSAFCTHWKQKHCPHSEDSAPSNHRWGGLFTFSEVGRPVPDWKLLELIGSNGSINKYHFTDELVLTEGEIVGLQYGTTTTGGFQQNFGVGTNFNNVFYDLLRSYFMPGFEQICRVANYREKIQLSTTELQYLQPDLSFNLTLALASPTCTSWVSDVFKGTSVFS